MSKKLSFFLPALLIIISFISFTLDLKAQNQTSSLTAPAISYAEQTVTYIAEKLIPPLRLTNKGGVVPPGFYGSTFLLAGSGNQGSADGTGIKASFGFVLGYAVDSRNNIYVADAYNHNIRKIVPGGVVSTFAGSGKPGYLNATGKKALFFSPHDLAIDTAGTLYVADGNLVIRKITANGVVTTFAGSGKSALVDGKGKNASFVNPEHLTIDKSGNLYVADNNKIRKVTPDGVVTTLATGYDFIQDIATDAAGNIYITATAYASNQKDNIIKITPKGIKTSIAAVPGCRAIVVDTFNNIYVIGMGGLKKVTPGGTVTDLPADPSVIYGLGIDASGNLYGGNINQSQVVMVKPFGFSVTPALPPGLQLGEIGDITGTPTKAFPAANYKIKAYNAKGTSSYTIRIAIDAALQAPAIAYGGPYTFVINKQISAVKPVNGGGAVPAGIYGQVTSFAGTNTGGYADGKGDAARFNYPVGLTTDAAGNVYVADQENNRIRKITPARTVSTIAGNGLYKPTNGNGTQASFYHPSALAIDNSGNIFVADGGNNIIRKITPKGDVTTFAGGQYNGSTEGNGTRVTMTLPWGIAADWKDNLYVTFPLANQVRKITSNADVTNFAGSGKSAWTDGTGKDASFGYPSGIAVDGKGNIYVADQRNHVIRKITPAGVVTTLAGNGTAGLANGTGKAAAFNTPYALAVDGTGNVYVADYENNQIRMISPAGVVTTLAGSKQRGYNNGEGTAASFDHPAGIALDGKGNLYESDFYGHTVRKINITGYTISPALAKGLVFDKATGVITGTPATAQAATVYTITAFNGAGSSSAKVVIKTDPFDFKPLNVSYGTPDFSPVTAATVSYKSSNSAVATIYKNRIHVVGVGTTVISATSNGYSLKQTLTVDPAALTIVAQDARKVAGTSNPKFTAHYWGFVNGDTVNVLTKLPVFKTTATKNSAAGSYPITVSDAAAANYQIYYRSGTLVVTKAVTTNNLALSPSADLTSEAINYASGPVVKPSLSPNGDGINDALIIEGIQNYPDNKLSILNSNGIKVFETVKYDNINNLFTGRSNINGAMQKAGTYYFSLDYKNGTITKHKTGYVVIKY